MKKLVLALMMLTLMACGGAPFEAAPGDSSAAGSALSPSEAGEPGAGQAGAEPTLAGSGGSSGAAGSAGSGGAPERLPPAACTSPLDVEGGYDGSLTTAPVCLRTKEALNTIACTYPDGRSIEVNGSAVTCGARSELPGAIAGYNYIVLGQGSNPAMAIRWFMTLPTATPCSARYWASGDLYAPGEVMLGVCSAPGTVSACSIGQAYAFSCQGTRCSSVQPGGNDWQAEWTLQAECTQ